MADNYGNLRSQVEKNVPKAFICLVDGTSCLCLGAVAANFLYKSGPGLCVGNYLKSFQLAAKANSKKHYLSMHGYYLYDSTAG